MKVLERLTALVLIMLLSPMLFIIAIMVKLSSPGPVIFKELQPKGNDKKYLYKYRTMYAYIPRDTDIGLQDSKVTPIGRFLRKTGLDELPFLFNVLLGNSSVVDSFLKKKSFLYQLAFSVAVKNSIKVIGYALMGLLYCLFISDISSYVLIAFVVLSLCHAIDGLLICYRYKRKIYGNCAQELFEAYRYLASKDNGTSGGDPMLYLEDHKQLEHDSGLEGDGVKI